jgi:4-hydroxy-2-oxoheptanedioate aldolase
MTPSLKPRLQSGQKLLGAWCNLPSPAIAEIAGRSGFDFVVVDFQHGLIDEGLAADMFRAIEATGAAPVARAGWKDPARLGRLLDQGAAAVIVPMIDSARDAADVIRACMFPPAGARSFGPIRAARGRSGPEYLAAAGEETCVLPMIETVGALAEAREIASIPGVAGLFVGPADLSLGIGLPPARDHRDAIFRTALDSVVTACRQNGVAAGIQAQRDLAAHRFEEGFSFVTAAMDSADLAASFDETRRAVADPRACRAT